MARTSKRRAGGLARVQSRSSRLAAEYAKRLVRKQTAKRKRTSDPGETPWWMKKLMPGQT
jgi:hypothetical protein